MPNNEVSVSDAQFVAGHMDPQTRLNYAQAKDTKEFRGRLKTTYWHGASCKQQDTHISMLKKYLIS